MKRPIPSPSPVADLQAPVPRGDQARGASGEPEPGGGEDSGFDYFWAKLQRLRQVCNVANPLFAAWLETAAEKVRHGDA